MISLLINDNDDNDDDNDDIHIIDDSISLL